MSKFYSKFRSPISRIKAGCLHGITTVTFCLALTSPIMAQPLSDKLLKDMGGALHRLTPHQKENQTKPAQPNNTHKPAFDFYVLALSWSPSFCAENSNKQNAQQQCGTSRPYGFIIHGLWPQYHRGYPQSCSHDQSNNQVPRDIVSDLREIMPSASLMRHQWRKHGTCSDLSQRDYFTTLQDAYDTVVIPPALRNVATPRMVDPKLVEKAFIAANPGLPADAITVTCKRRRLEEVRICMNSDLKFQSCAEVDRNSCRSRSVTLLPNR